MAKLDQEALAQTVNAVLASLQGQAAGAAPPPKSFGRNTFGKFDPVSKDRQLLNTFTRRGFTNVILMDRNDPTKDFNVRPWKGWVKLGRVVRKGERGVRGLFQVDQTDVIAPASPSKVRKPSLKPVPVKSQLPLV